MKIILVETPTPLPFPVFYRQRLNMKNRFLSIIITCIASFNAHTGSYAGLNLGVNTVTIHKDLIYPLGVNTPTSSTFYNGYTNFHGQILAGYEVPFNQRFSAAVEANAALFTGESQYTINNWYFNEGVSAKEKFQYGFALFLLPVYHYNESVSFFAGPGISRSYFSVKTDHTAGNVGISANFNQWLTGGGFKVGTITKLNNNLDLLLTYQFTQYNSLTRTQLEPLSEDSLQGRYKPNVNAVLIGLRATMPERVILTKYIT
jgi:opacity protein-like surface antigen